MKTTLKINRKHASPSCQITFGRGRLALLWAVLTTFHACVAFAQADKWDPGVSKDFFQEGKTAGAKPLPTHRLAPQACDDCQAIVDQLQAALDEWYGLQLLDAQVQREKYKSTWVNPDAKLPDGAPTETDINKQTAAALAGLDQPKDSGKAAKGKQTVPKGKKPDDFTKEKKKELSTKITELAKKLQECLKKCAPTEETPTPTPTPNEEVKKEVPPPPKFDIIIPDLPGCFDSEGDRENYRKQLDELLKQLEIAKKKYDVQLAEPKDKAWQEFKEKFEEARAKISAQNFPGDDGKDAIDKKPLCKQQTGGGKGQGKGKEKGKPKKPRIPTGHNVSIPGGPEDSFCALISEGKIKIETAGTGETIGHVADLIIENLTDEPLTIAIPALFLESRSGKNQHYGCPEGETVEVPPLQTLIVPLKGVCLARNKPPVGQGERGDLLVNECDYQNPDSHLAQEKARKMLRIAASKYEAADKLDEDGALKDIPYRDKKKRKEIVVQWSTWMDPRLSEITGAPPATKDDLRKVVYKQIEEQGPMTPEKKKKIDEGIDIIFEKVELTTEKAKDLEKPAPIENVEGPGEEGQGTAPMPTPPSGPSNLGDGPKTTEEGSKNADQEKAAGTTAKPPRPKDGTVKNPDGTTTTTTTVKNGNGTETTTETTTNNKKGPQEGATKEISSDFDKAGVLTRKKIVLKDGRRRLEQERVENYDPDGKILNGSDQRIQYKDAVTGDIAVDTNAVLGPGGKIVGGTETTTYADGRTGVRPLP